MMLLGLALHPGASYIQGPITWMWPYRDSQTSLFFISCSRAGVADRPIKFDL
jgi:hypothetical protein